MAAHETVRFSYMGKDLDIPAGLTILTALEHSGRMITRGAGCRAGFCGACATMYRQGDDPQIRVALACQTVARDGMRVTPLPYFPIHTPHYDLGTTGDPGEKLLSIYPELTSCLGCSTCTFACPVDLKVMDYVGAMIAGNLASVAALSFDCVSCGLCAARCPVGIAPYASAQVARRLHAVYEQPRCSALVRRVEEIERGDYDAQLAELVAMPVDELKRMYAEREIRV